jgi:hypothetical protein
MSHFPSIDRRQFLGQCAAGAVAAGMTPALANAAPAKAAPTAPLAMWALTGTLKSADVVRQLDAYAAAGWGVVLYPRSGLEIEYLSDAWFERIRFIVEQCAARSIEVWLYDEYCWPSGHAKGLVTQGHPELEAQVLCVERDGRSEVQHVAGSANLLQAEATERFLAVTHERYAATVGKYFGTTVRAIFTDEPSLAMYHQPRKKGDTAWRVLWSDGLERALGGDFRQRLAAAGTGAAEPRLWRDYWAAYARLYHDAWTVPIARWCAEHKIALSGHLLGENDFGSHVTNYGSLRRQLNEFQAPGIDEISTRWEVDRCEAMTLATIAEYPGRERMVEVFALGPCHMRMETMKRMVDLCAACGVDRYVMAICPFDLRGSIEKRGYLGVHNMLQPWWRDYARPWAQYLAEVAQRARQAQPLGVPWPSDEELWAVAGPDPRRSKPLQQLSKKFTDAAREVIRSRLPAAPVKIAKPQAKLDAQWTFAPREWNSLRIDGSSLVVVDVPRVAELSVQTQLVRSLRINGQAIDLAAAPADTRFDLSYVRVPVAKLLRAGANTFEIQSTEPKPLPFLPALILWGNFAVDAERRLVAPKKSIALGDWRTQGYPAFCGTGCYRATVEWAKPPARLGVDASDYPTRVLVNGRECGRRPWAPFDFDLRGAARPGKNQIVIEIASTVGHLFVPQKAPSMDLSQVWAVRSATVSPSIGLFDVWVSE